MGPEILALSAGLQAAQGFAAYQQGNAQAKAATQMADYNARVIRQRAEVQKTQTEKQQRLQNASARVRAASSGASLGSFEDVFESNKKENLLDLAMIDYDSKLNQSQTLYQGQIEANNAKTQGKNALISGIAKAGETGYQAYNSWGAGATNAPMTAPIPKPKPIYGGI